MELSKKQKVFVVLDSGKKLPIELKEILKCDDEIIEFFEESFGCDGNCTNESVNFCECGTLFDNNSIESIVLIDPPKSNLEPKIQPAPLKQQLKAEISEFKESLEWYRDNVDKGYANGFLNHLYRIQKLSAV